ncbi:MAG: hypothetical protein AMXMBFR64_13820 [Myxococcales bacterium]
MSPPMRICPQCRTRTEEARCPHDGYQTVSEELVGTVPRPDPMVGHVFEGRYKVDALLGRGGFGSVYRAFQLNMGNRPVALKLLRRELASSLEQIGRFQREAHAASLLQHPSTIKVFDFGQTEDGDLFMVVELLQGEPLNRLLAREGRLDPDRAISIACQVLRSLGEAHDQGIVHRDIKPDNIFIQEVRGERDMVKVLDFGVAKLATTSEGGTLTQTGAVLGSPAYMAPEQALGHRVDARADLYAVGVLLYEMLAGRLPFDGTHIMQVLAAHVVSPVPPLVELAPVSAELAAVVHACLEKDPSVRPPSADALRHRLESARTGAPVALGPPSPEGPRTGASPSSQVTMGSDPTLGATPVETPPSTILRGGDTVDAIRAARGVRPRRALVAAAAAVAVVVAAVTVALWPRERRPPEASAPSTAHVAADAPRRAPGPREATSDPSPEPAPTGSPLPAAPAPLVTPVVVHVMRGPAVLRDGEPPDAAPTRRGLETEIAQPAPRKLPTKPQPPGGVEWQ